MAGHSSSFMRDAALVRCDQEEVIPTAFSGAAASQRGVSSMFVKTKKCRFFGMGMCTKGDACNYAHNRDELRPVPDFFRTKLCPAVTRGDICNDPLCKFAHKKEEKRKLVGPSRQFKTEVLQPVLVNDNMVKRADIADIAQSAERCSQGLLLKELVGPVEVSAEKAQMPTADSGKGSQCECGAAVQKRVRPRGCRAGRRRSWGKSTETSDDPAEAPRCLADSTSTVLKALSSTGKVAQTVDVVFDGPIQHGSKIQIRENQCFFVQEMDPQSNQDLCDTIVCPVLICTGLCNKPDCAYAHSISDLRIAYKKQILDTKLRLPGEADAVDFCREITPSTDAEGSDHEDASDFEEASTCTFFKSESMDSDFSDYRCPSPPPDSDSPCSSQPSEDVDDEEVLDVVLTVKNTFLLLEPVQPLREGRLRRVHSAPGCLDKLIL